jgi:1,4-dihydroxy-6-naphthoate synthase
LHTITVAHSPDADDIFMYYAVKFGWVSLEDTLFSNIALDIETLNVEALKGTYDISAISFALYPFIKDDYALLKTAVSFGNGYGPKLVKLKNKKVRPGLKNMKVALSGQYTTNAMLFRIVYPEAKIIYKNFLEIEEAVLSGEADLGVLIHESILTYNNALEVEREMWDIWLELCKEELPLPLGGMGLRRSIPLHRAVAYEEALIKAVRVARDDKELLSKMLLERGLIRVDNETLQHYLELYANDDSIELNETQYKAIDKLYQIGFDAKIYKQCIRAQEYTLPNDYNKLRFG